MISRPSASLAAFFHTGTGTPGAVGAVTDVDTLVPPPAVGPSPPGAGHFRRIPVPHAPGLSSLERPLGDLRGAAGPQPGPCHGVPAGGVMAGPVMAGRRRMLRSDFGLSRLRPVTLDSGTLVATGRVTKPGPAS